MGQDADEDDIRQEVRRLVHKWDPYALLAHGAPEDEWDFIIAMILAKVPTIRSPLDARRVVFEVFSSQFGSHNFPMESCSSYGDDLFRALARLGMVDGLHDEP
jgi:hypothetical protein